MGGSSRQREKDDKALEQKSIEALVDVDPFHLAGTQGADYGVNDSLGGRLELSWERLAWDVWMLPSR